MDLKSEYLKRIKIIRNKKETRLKELELNKMDDNEKEEKLQIKIENYQNNIKEKTLSYEIDNYELFDLNKNHKTNPLIEYFVPQNINFFQKINDCENKINEEIIKVIINEKKSKRETVIQELKIKIDFKQKNNVLIIKNNNFNNEIIDLDKKIKNKNYIFKKKLGENEINLSEKFINRNKNLLFLENHYQKIKINRNKNKDIQNKIKNKLIENRLFKIQIEKKGEIELIKLNQYIKSQKIYIKNELSTEKKKEYFKNIKKKNKEYLDKINKHKTRLEESNKKLNTLKEELSNNQIVISEYSYKSNKIPSKIMEEIQDIKSEIENLEYTKISISLEKKINLDLLEKNKLFYQEEIKNLVQKYKLDIEYLYHNENQLMNDFMFEINNIKLNKKNQVINNKNNLKLFLEKNLIELYNYKKKNFRIKELEIKINSEKREIEDFKKKLKSTQYILRKNKLKNELKYSKMKEDSNIKNIDDLIEIEEINQKILSICN